MVLELRWRQAQGDETREIILERSLKSLFDLVKMPTSYFKDNGKLDDSSNFAAWKIRLEFILDDNDVLEYVQGKVLEPSSNASSAIKSKYKKGELKANKVIINVLQDRLLVYHGSLNKSKDSYDKLVRIYEVNYLNHILSLKDQFKEMKMNKGESGQSYIMRVSRLRDHL